MLSCHWKITPEPELQPSIVTVISFAIFVTSVADLVHPNMETCIRAMVVPSRSADSFDIFFICFMVRRGFKPPRYQASSLVTRLKSVENTYQQDFIIISRSRALPGSDSLKLCLLWQPTRGRASGTAFPGRPTGTRIRTIGHKGAYQPLSCGRILFTKISKGMDSGNFSLSYTGPLPVLP